MILKKESGHYVEPREEMEDELINYFETIMKEDMRDKYEHTEKITMHIPNLIT